MKILRSRRMIVAVGMLVLAGTITITMWIALAPNPGDQQNFFYFMWKRGLWNLSTEDICAGMIGDRNRDRLVIGKSRAELQRRFGLRTVEVASNYLRDRYNSSDYRGQDVAFLGNCNWMVVFENDRAINLILVKG